MCLDLTLSSSPMIGASPIARRGLFISEMAGYLTALMRSMVDGADSRL